MLKETEYIIRRLGELAYRSEVFISNDIGYRFEYGQLRQMNPMYMEKRLPSSLDEHPPINIPSNYYWSGVCVDIKNIIEHGIDFVGTEEEVWHKIQSLSYR